MNKSGASFIFLSGVLAAAVCAAVCGDTVVLIGGDVLQGRAMVRGDCVLVSSDTGTVTMPSWRVRRIYRAGTAKGGSLGGNPRGERRAPVRHGNPGRNTPAIESPLRKTEKMLDKKISVDFQDQPLSEVVACLQELGDANIAVSTDVDDATVPTVTLRLKDVKLRTVLDVILDDRDLGYSVSKGGVVRIGKCEKIVRYVRRVHDIRDLLFNISDRAARRADVGRDREEGGDSAAGGWGGRDDWDDDEDDDDKGRARHERLIDRADSFRLLIQFCIAPGTWKGGGAIGGRRREDRDRAEGRGDERGRRREW